MILLAHWVNILYLIRCYHSYFQGLVMRIYSLCTGGAMNVGRRWNSPSSTWSYCLLRDTQTHAAGSHEGICDALGAYREPGSVRGVTETTATLTDSALPFWSFGSNRGEWEFFRKSRYITPSRQVPRDPRAWGERVGVGGSGRQGGGEWGGRTGQPGPLVKTGRAGGRPVGWSAVRGSWPGWHVGWPGVGPRIWV